MSGLTLDAGALIAFDRGDRRAHLLLRRVVDSGTDAAVPAAALAQAWRDGSRQVRLVRLLASPNLEIVALDARMARAIGQVCARSGASDVVDVSVALCARLRRHRVVTSDPDDIRLIDPTLEIIAM